jgi:phospholipid-binding lipoprotein MlaA
MIWRPIIKVILVFTLGGFLYGCASQPQKALPIIPPMHSLSEVQKQEYTMINVYDPIEPFNRIIYFFNAKFDKYIFLPIVNIYEFITPDLIENGISNFFSNIGEIRNFTNTLLQLKFSRSLKTGARFIVNSTVGIGGIWDPATRFLGIFQHREDFGQTLGYYGLGPGPYLVIPIAGPSNLRDATGLVVDSFIFNALYPFDFGDGLETKTPFYFVRAVDQRHRISFRYYETGSPFEYDLVRLLYLKVREAEIAK